MRKEHFLERSLRRLPIRKKLTYFLIPIILLSYIFSCGTVLSISVQETEGIVSKQGEIIANQKVQLVDNYLSQLRRESEVFMNDELLQSLLTQEKASLSEEEQRNVENQIRLLKYNTIINYDECVMSISLSNICGDEYIWNADQNTSAESLSRRLRAHSAEAAALDGEPLYSYDRLSEGLISLTRTIYGQDGAQAGSIMIEFDLDFLESISDFMESNFGSSDVHICIMTPDGLEIYNSTGIPLDRLLSSEKETSSLSVNGSDYKITRTSSQFSEWVVYASINETELFRAMRRTTLVMFILLAVSAVVAFLAIHFISSSISGQFGRFIEKIRATETPEKAELIQVESDDEFKELADAYNEMILRINRLIDTVYSKELLQKDAEIKAFQAQINPHFLYNTLDIINGLVDLGRTEDIKRTVIALANLMRMALKGAEIQTVRECCRNAEEFMFIERLRYPDKLVFMIKIPPAMMDYCMPKLIFQPVLENAISHGVSEILGKGMVGLFGHEELDALVFEIRDNGVGFPQSVLDRLQSSEDVPVGERKNSIGLRNIQRRIQLMYGEPYGITAENAEGGGARVTIRLPKIKNAALPAPQSEPIPEEKEENP